MTRRQRCSMPRRPGGLRWRRPLAVLLGLTVLLALDGSGILRVGTTVEVCSVISAFTAFA